MTRPKPIIFAIALLLLGGSRPAPADQCPAQKLMPLDVQTLRHYATSIDVFGDWMIVGAPDDNDNGPDAGAVYFYHHDGTRWGEESKRLMPGGVEDDVFGRSVSISANVAVAGAMDADAAYAFRRIGSTWTGTGRVDPPGSTDKFGVAVANSDEVIAIGAYRDNNHRGRNAGSVYVYRWDGATWAFEQELVASDAVPEDQLGWSVAMSGGDVILAGANGSELDCPDERCDYGAAYVFRFDGKSWVEEAKLIASDRQMYHYFGYSLDIDGDRAVVGAPFTDNEHGENAGTVYVFDRGEGGWTETARLVASGGAAGDSFGVSTTLLGDVLVVGAWGEDDQEEDAGAAYVFRLEDGAWIQTARLEATDGTYRDGFGNPVVLTERDLLIGARRDGDRAPSGGSLYSYARTGSDCNENDVPDICEVFAGTTEDCNGNGIPDACDLANETSPDCDGNGRPDECDVRQRTDAYSGELSPIGRDNPQTYVVPKPPIQLRDVTLSFTASMDLDNTRVDVDLNGIQVGTLFRSVGAHCPDPPAEATLIVPRILFNQASDDGGQDVGITMTAPLSDDDDCEGAPYIAITVDYERASDCNGNGDPDACDVIDGWSEDTNENGMPDECECPGDVDADGVVGLDDLLLVLSAWGPCEGACPADVDGSGDVAFPDLLIVLGAWGPCRIEPADDCADAPVVGDGRYLYSTLDATTDGEDVPAECDEGRGVRLRRDVWIIYAAGRDGVATAGICSSSFDSRLAIYPVGDCTGVPLACQDDGCGMDATRAEVLFEVTAGERYLIRIGGRVQTGVGILAIESAAGVAR